MDIRSETRKLLRAIVLNADECDLMLGILTFKDPLNLLSSLLIVLVVSVLIAIFLSEDLTRDTLKILAMRVVFLHCAVESGVTSPRGKASCLDDDTRSCNHRKLVNLEEGINQPRKK